VVDVLEVELELVDPMVELVEVLTAVDDPLGMVVEVGVVDVGVIVVVTAVVVVVSSGLGGTISCTLQAASMTTRPAGQFLPGLCPPE
jgi:hypothetical protein